MGTFGPCLTGCQQATNTRERINTFLGAFYSDEVNTSVGFDAILQVGAHDFGLPLWSRNLRGTMTIEHTPLTGATSKYALVDMFQIQCTTIHGHGRCQSEDGLAKAEWQTAVVRQVAEAPISGRDV